MRVVIVGAGLLGICTAYFLSRAGLRPLVLERRNGAGLETSYANGGMITPSQSDPWNRPGILRDLLRWIGREHAPVLLRPSAIASLLGWGAGFLRNARPDAYRRNLVSNARLARYSQSVLKQMRSDTAIDYERAEKGTMGVYRNAGSLQRAAAFLNVLAQHGIQGQVLDRDGVLAREPALQPVGAEFAGGIYYPGDESGDAYEFCRAVTDVAMQAGTEFRYGVSVSGFQRGSNGITALETTGGAVTGDHYILACGSYTPLLAGRLGLSVPIRPIKGYSITLDMRNWRSRPVVPIIDDEFHIAATPLGTRLRVAGTAEFDRYDVSVNPRRIENMVQFVRHTYPREAQHVSGDDINAWAGLRPYSCDGVPILGGTAISNVFLNSGHGHLGWTLAAGSGKLLADLIMGRTPELDPAPYQLSRFA